MTAYEPIIARLLTLHPKRIDLSLDRMWRMLDRLGHPERSLPPVIHVAGTNGKGSTVAFMRAILEAAGRSVHVYTSPHLVRFNERFRLARPAAASSSPMRRSRPCWSECERANGDEPITVFEIETAAAFLLFTRHSGRRAAARSRPRRSARRHQCDRTGRWPASSPRCRWIISTFSATRWRRSRQRRRHPQARRAGGDRAAERRRARR